MKKPRYKQRAKCMSASTKKTDSQKIERLKREQKRIKELLRQAQKIVTLTLRNTSIRSHIHTMWFLEANDVFVDKHTNPVHLTKRQILLGDRLSLGYLEGIILAASLHNDHLFLILDGRGKMHICERVSLGVDNYCWKKTNIVDSSIEKILQRLLCPVYVEQALIGFEG